MTSMTSFRPSLQLVILLPGLALILVGGFILYQLNLRTVSTYADQSIRNTLDALLKSAVTIADSEVDRQNRESKVRDPEDALTYQLNTRIRLEDFARGQNVGIVVLADGTVDFFTGLSQDEALVLAQKANGAEGLDRYVASARFSPWDWKILVAKDATDFDALVDDVRRVYIGSIATLLGLAVLLILALRQFLVSPIYGIARDLSAGRAPKYEGISELTHLAHSIGGMLTNLQTQSRERETILRSMSDAITVYDADMRLMAWNPQYERLQRFPPDMLKRGLHLADIIRYNIDRGDYGKVDPEERIRKTLLRAKTLTPPRFEIDWADGTSFEIRRAPMPDGGFVTTYTDITHVKQSARLEAANEAKARFLENMSHDLRKPIAAIIEDCEAFGTSSVKQSKEARRLLRNIDGNARHLLGMVDEILEMARIEAGQLHVKLEPTQLDVLAERAKRVVERAAASKGLSLENRINGTFHLKSDPRLLSRILVNLLSNAVTYTESGKVTLSAEYSDSGIRISVADTGSGISRENQELIFGKFQRLQETSGVTQQGVGLGLGLPISRELARALGGELTLRSELGQGSTFILELPQHKAQSDEQQQTN